MALVFNCYLILVTIVFQMFAVVNQRRYRSAFYMSFATVGLSILLFVMRYWYVCSVLTYQDPEDENSNNRKLWWDVSYLLALPIVALLQVIFFTKRPPSLFEKKSAVKN